MFIQCGSRFVNLGYVREIEAVSPGERGTPRVQITFADGKRAIEAADFDDLERSVGQIVPAAPGWRVVEVIPPADGYEVDRSNHYFDHDVIAFRIGPLMTEPVPITMEGELSSRYVIVQPNGACSDFDGRYESVEAWKAKMDGDGER